MHLSEYFLSHLHKRHVISQLEYDEHLASLQSAQVHLTMNKKLMDVINLKPRQLQELFVDQLFRYEAQLFPALSGVPS